MNERSHQKMRTHLIEALRDRRFLGGVAVNVFLSQSVIFIVLLKDAFREYILCTRLHLRISIKRVTILNWNLVLIFFSESHSQFTGKPCLKVTQRILLIDRNQSRVLLCVYLTHVLFEEKYFKDEAQFDISKATAQSQWYTIPDQTYLMRM